MPAAKRKAAGKPKVTVTVTGLRREMGRLRRELAGERESVRGGMRDELELASMLDAHDVPAGEPNRRVAWLIDQLDGLKEHVAELQRRPAAVEPPGLLATALRWVGLA